MFYNQIKIKKRLAMTLRRAANRLDPQSGKIYLQGVYYDGRHFVLTNPALTLYAYDVPRSGPKTN